MMNSFRHSDLSRNQVESSWRTYSPLTRGVAETLRVREHKANGQMCPTRQLRRGTFEEYIGDAF